MVVKIKVATAKIDGEPIIIAAGLDQKDLRPKVSYFQQKHPGVSIRYETIECEVER